MSENYYNWVRHFWKTNLDGDIVAEYDAAGIGDPPVLKRHEMDAGTDVGHLTLAFCHPVLFGKEQEYGDGVGIFSDIAIHLKDRPDGGYVQDLPFGVLRDDSRKTLLQRLGEPDESDEDDFWDSWNIDGLVVTALWTEDFEDLETLTVYLPRVSTTARA